MARNKLLSTLLFVAILVLNACNSDKNKESTNSNDQPADQVRVQLSWTDSVAFASFYMAEANGYYANENIDVEIISGGIDPDGNFINPIERVTSGQADFAIVDSTILLSARESGTPIVAIASIFQTHPLALVSLANKNITDPQDLAGANVDVSFNSRLIYDTLLHEEDLDPTTINTLDRTDLTINSLINGTVDVIDAWVITEIPELLAAGQEINLILASDYGVDVYPNVIFTTEAMIADNPALVERFLRATLRGTQAIIDDPSGTVQVLSNFATYRGEEIETLAMEQALPLFLPVGSRPGAMQPEVWQFTHDMLVEQGILAAPLAIESAYTLSFLASIEEN